MKRIAGLVLAVLPGVFIPVSSQVVTLQQCIDSTLLLNPQIKEASNEVALSESSVDIARSAKYLSVFSENSAGYSNELSSGSNYKTASAGIVAEQVLWQKNKIGFSIDGAKQSVIASKADREGRMQEMCLAVKLAYFTCIQQQWLFKVSAENVARAGLFVDYAKERFMSGTGRKSDILKAESDYSAALFDQNSFLNSLKRSRNELSMLSGIPVERLSELDSSWIEEPDSSAAKSLLKSTPDQYPEYRSIISLVSAQQAKINQARSDQFPGLYLNAGYQWIYNPVIKNQDIWFTTLTLRWSLFKGKENHYRIQSEATRKIILENQAEQVRLFYQKELANRLISLAESTEQIRLTGDLIITTSANLETATAQFLAGTGSMLELVDARVAHLQARQNNIKAITDYRMAVARLERLTGTNNQK